MLSRLAIAGAVGATMFALAGAGAAALEAGGTDGVVQQTNAMTATCLNPATSALHQGLEYQTHVNNQYVTKENVSQQNVEPYCSGQFIQFTLKMDNGSLVYSNKVFIPTSNFDETVLTQSFGSPPPPGYAVYGIDLQPTFPAGVCAADVEKTIATIANTIDGPGSNSAGDVVGTLPTCANDGFFNTPASTTTTTGGDGSTSYDTSTATTS